MSPVSAPHDYCDGRINYLWHPAIDSEMRVPPIMSENHQENGVTLDFIK